MQARIVLVTCRPQYYYVITKLAHSTGLGQNSSSSGPRKDPGEVPRNAEQLCNHRPSGEGAALHCTVASSSAASSGQRIGLRPTPPAWRSSGRNAPTPRLLKHTHTQVKITQRQQGFVLTSTPEQSFLRATLSSFQCARCLSRTECCVM